ncbi:MAG: hypothetical protein GX130_07655 [Candidatus Hydrogenedens sp.]|nr:hypothetical protein [Candidatus Hydrogenedens sp.]
MRIYLLAIPLVAAVATLVYLTLREMARAWLHHRLRMLLLEWAEKKPGFSISYEELSELLEEIPAPSIQTPKTDITVTGLYLAMIGLFFVVVYALIGKSQWAVGAYFGGVACVVIGFILTTVGFILRFLRKPPL